MEYKVGMKVVCVTNEIADLVRQFRLPIPIIIKDEILTISKVNTSVDGFTCLDFTTKASSGVDLSAHFRRPFKCAGYLSTFFRPLDETFAEDVLEKIKEEIEEEYLVRV